MKTSLPDLAFREQSGRPVSFCEIDNPKYNGGCLCAFCSKIQDAFGDCQDCSAYRALILAMEEPEINHDWSPENCNNLFASHSFAISDKGLDTRIPEDDSERVGRY